MASSTTQHDAPPTKVRQIVLSATTLTSFMLYLDRVCMGVIIASESFPLAGPEHEMERRYINSAFFGAYALCQVPSGWLSDGFGARGVMTVCVAMWSFFTLLTGVVDSFWALLLVRVGMGIFQAGAYPTSVGLLRSWIPRHLRATASAMVASGGRIGGAVAPTLTVAIIGLALSLNLSMTWNAPLMVYGVVGFVVSALFWFVFRRTPQEHPWCNDAECALIAEGQPPLVSTASHLIPWGLVLTNRSMWLNCLIQFCTNVGWVFIVTDMPSYLKDRGLSPEYAGWLNTGALLIGMVGMMLGGPLTDWTTRRWGIRWGRAIPVAGSRLLASLAYVGCLVTDDVGVIVASLAIMSLATDLGVPGVWAYQQDVGGRHTAALLGWGNMWGNLGAFISPIFAGWILNNFDANRDWREVFFAFMVFFFVSAIAGLGLDGRQVIEHPPEPSPAK